MTIDFANIYDDAKRAMDGSLATVESPTSRQYLDAHAAAARGPAETRISIILPTTAYFMSGVRDFTMTIVQNMTGFSQKWAFRFQSIVDELCNNAIEHGSAPGKEVKVTFVSRSGESIYVAVEDSGTGPSKVTPEQMYTLVKDRKAAIASNTFTGIRGRGLAQIVSQWTDELKFDNIEGGGLRVSVLKKLETAGNQGNSTINTIKLQ